MWCQDFASTVDSASRAGSVPESLTGDMVRQRELDNMAKNDDDEFEALLAKVQFPSLSL